MADKPAWLRISDMGGGIMILRGGIAMLLTREIIGPWVEIVGGGHYEIDRA